MKTHELKIERKYFDAILNGTKTFELRINDRDFKKWDVLILKEYDPELKKYTSEEIGCYVTYITYGPSFGLQEGFCCMAIKIRE